MVTTTFGAQQLAALVALLNYDHIPLRYRFICDFFFVVGGEFFWRHSIFWIVLTILVFFSKSFPSLQIAATFRRGARSLVSIV